MAASVRFSALCNFTPKQLIATETADAYKYTLFGGSRGPGKSYWLRWYGLRLLLLFREMFGIPFPVVGLFCEDYPVLRDRQISKIEQEFPRELGQVKSTQEQGLGFYLHGGGMIALRNLDKPSKYQSAEFAAVLVDELTKNTVETFDILRGSLRWPGIPPEWWKFVAGSNPGGVGHLWVKDYFLDKRYPPELEAERDRFAFVPALPDDNPYLDAAYWKMLESLPPALARAWRWGDWDVFEGQVFSEWRRDLHVVKPFTLPDPVRWTGVDWGYAVPWCCYWLARCVVPLPGFSPELKRRVVYREAYQAGLTDPEQAERIVKLSGDERLRWHLADPSMWTRKTTGKITTSTAQVYREHGVILRRGENDRLTGKRRVHEALALMEDGKPGLVIFENCTNLIRTLPALPYDETRVEDVDTDAEDHAYDALRYALSGRPKKRKSQPPPADYWAAARRGGQQREIDRLRSYPRVEDGEQDDWDDWDES